MSNSSLQTQLAVAGCQSWRRAQSARYGDHLMVVDAHADTAVSTHKTHSSFVPTSSRPVTSAGSGAGGRRGRSPCMHRRGAHVRPTSVKLGASGLVLVSPTIGDRSGAHFHGELVHGCGRTAAASS